MRSTTASERARTEPGAKPTSSAAMDNSYSGIIGVIVGALIIVGLIYFVFGDRLGLRGPVPSVPVTAPVPKSATP